MKKFAPKQRIVPCLSFDHEAEEAAKFYVSIFKRSRMGNVTRYPEAGQGANQLPAGSVLTVEFELDGQTFLALNGGPSGFNQAISLQVYCATQAEVDYYWEKLGKGGDKKAQQCSWLKDKYGVSWQIVPTAIIQMIGDRDQEKARRAFLAMTNMKKLDIAKLKKAFAGK